MKKSSENDSAKSKLLGDKLSDKNFTKNKSKFWKRFVLIIVILSVIGNGIYYFLNDSGDDYEFVQVTRADVVEMVEITGNVEADATITLSFQESGQVKEIFKDVGDRVEEGDLIASLTNTDQALALERARANLASQVALLNERKAGATPEQIRIAEVAVDQAQAAYDQIKVELESAQNELVLIREKYEEDERRVQLLVDDAKDKLEFAERDRGNRETVDDQALENARDDLYSQMVNSLSVLETSLSDLDNYLLKSTNAGNTIKRYYPSEYQTNAIELAQAMDEYDLLVEEIENVEEITVEFVKNKSREMLSTSRVVINIQSELFDLVNSINVHLGFSETEKSQILNTLNGNLTNLNSATLSLDIKRQNLLSIELQEISGQDSAENSVVIAENFYEQQLQALDQLRIDHSVDLNNRMAKIESLKAQLRAQEAAIESAKANLAEIKAPPRAVDIASLEANVLASSVDVRLREEDFDKTLLKAPTDGVISRRNVEVGEDLSVTLQREVAFEMISDDLYKVEADIAEVDIGKVEVGDVVSITLDPLGEDTVLSGTI
ncbi:HlyD family efflux transporter periplasmic adaptor subunit, partial [Candidatus Peregrinibacteria bacterium]|nr:HlyD family efflux transporter periplasmic adaptor subunit [Candidatus Peregrinibacteria bacterium]